MITHSDLQLLDAMLAIHPWQDPRNWGTVNFATTTGDGYFTQAMARLERAGLVRRGVQTGDQQHWHATTAGIAAAGIPRAQRRRAIAAAVVREEVSP